MERERLRNCSKEINSTYRQSKTTQLNLRQFIESRKTKDITFSDITGEFAESFKIFLKKELRRIHCQIHQPFQCVDALEGR